MTTLHCHIDDRIKLEAEEALHKQGISLNKAIELFVTEIALSHGLPLMNKDELKQELKIVHKQWHDVHEAA